ncbi:hypothetical protein LLEC1_01630 [Akanthomyces lecanii]|uniref:AttH domain-containing protein n=1 Tax=Cordyceps confragosa TaxID=2714763 RepID=A0A179I243_CORDF|nr:hypothetical protein LLEC1_01630 [Akanthomyces lecanii]
MASNISHFKNDGGSVAEAPVTPAAHIPGSANIFPKFGKSISKDGWELWFFDCVSSEQRAAVIVGLNRAAPDGTGDGFKVQITAIWPDSTTWHRDLYFTESLVEMTSLETRGIWRDSAKAASVSFVSTDNDRNISLLFDVPGVVDGNMQLQALPGDSGLDSDPTLGPFVHYVRPLGRALVTAEMRLFEDGPSEARALQLGVRDQPVTGGVDRVWSLGTWPQIMTESYYLRTHVGPYAIQIMRIFSDMASGNRPYAMARLYHEGKLICAAQDVIAECAPAPLKDSLLLTKLYDGQDEECVRGTFADQNTGYLVVLVSKEVGKKWTFRVAHDRIVWNIPTSAPGPKATGNTGFIERVVGGLDGEAFTGIGTGGQCQL